LLNINQMQIYNFLFLILNSLMPMLLEQFSNNQQSISYRDLGANQYRDLVSEIQNVLSNLGIIDPPASCLRAKYLIRLVPKKCF
jgi:hypothetical protein